MPRHPSANLFDLIAARAPHPDKLALETRDATALTYGELFKRSARAANALVALGVKPGDRVAAQIEKSTDMIVVTLACLRAGAVLLPLNTAYTLAELEYFLGDAVPPFLGKNEHPLNFNDVVFQWDKGAAANGPALNSRHQESAFRNRNH